MNQNFQLSKTEKKLEWLMLLLAVFSFIIIGAGIYYQQNATDRDYLLVPLLLTIYGVFSLVYGISSITGGRLAEKWTPFSLFQIISSQLEKSNPESNARMLTGKILGIIAIAVSVAFFILTTTILKENL